MLQKTFCLRKVLITENILCTRQNYIRIFSVQSQYDSRKFSDISNKLEVVNIIYERIKDACQKKGMSVSLLEKEMDFSNGSICKWNENEPGIRKVQKVADYFGITIEELLK